MTACEKASPFGGLDCFPDFVAFALPFVSNERECGSGIFTHKGAFRHAERLSID